MSAPKVITIDDLPFTMAGSFTEGYGVYSKDLELTFASENAFLMWLTQHPEQAAGVSWTRASEFEFIRLEKWNDDEITVVYSECATNPNCDCTADALESKQYWINADIDKQGYHLTIEGERITEKLPDVDYDNVERNPEDCEKTEEVRYKSVYIVGYSEPGYYR